MSRARLIAIVVVGLVALAAGIGFSLRHVAPADTANASAPMFYALRLNDATGTERAMGEHRGRVVIINFWATWCVPCVEEIPMFSRIHAKHGDRVPFVGLGIDSPGNIAGFYLRFRPSYPLLAAGASGTELARGFGDTAGGLPFTVVLGPGGKVLDSRLGRVDEPTLEGWIARYGPPH